MKRDNGLPSASAALQPNMRSRRRIEHDDALLLVHGDHGIAGGIGGGAIEGYRRLAAGVVKEALPKRGAAAAADLAAHRSPGSVAGRSAPRGSGLALHQTGQAIGSRLDEVFAFFGSVNSRMPSLYLASALASSTSQASVKLRLA